MNSSPRAGSNATRPISAGHPVWWRSRDGAEYQIIPPVDGWRPHFQVRVITCYQRPVRGTFRYAEPFDRT